MNGNFYGKGRLKEADRLYDRLINLWCKETCAPRMRDRWTPDNPTLGQCSITAFLVQDILGGDVFGIPLPDGNFHCYNKVGDKVFDLTSEQFGGEEKSFDYESLKYPQSRDVHFRKEEKRLRYEHLKSLLENS